MLEQTPFGGMGIIGETYLVGEDLRMRSTSRFDSRSALKTIVPSLAAKQALLGNQSTLITEDYRGIWVLSSYTPLNVPGLKWAILAEIDETEVMVPMTAHCRI